MNEEYGLPAVMELPPSPMAEVDLLEWAKEVHASLQSAYIPQADRIENIIMAEDGIAPRPSPRGTRRLYYDRKAEVLYIDNRKSDEVGEWVPVGGAGVSGAYLPLAGGQMEGDIDMQDNSIFWSDPSPTPATLYQIIDNTGVYWIDDDTLINRYIGLFESGLVLDDQSSISYADDSPQSWDILWYDNDSLVQALYISSAKNIIIEVGATEILQLDANTMIGWEKELFIADSSSTSLLLATTQGGTKDIELGDGSATIAMIGSSTRPFYIEDGATPVVSELALLADAGDPTAGFTLQAGADITLSSTSEIRMIYGATIQIQSDLSAWWTALSWSAVGGSEFMMFGDSGTPIYFTGNMDRPWYDGPSEFGPLARMSDISSSKTELIPAGILTVYNGTGAQIDKGSVCYISGDQSGTPSVTLAKADSYLTTRGLLVIAAENIADSSSGSAYLSGRVSGFFGLTAGSDLYLSKDTAGAVTHTPPPQFSGHCVRLVGQAVSTTEVYFNPDHTWVRWA